MLMLLGEDESEDDKLRSILAQLEFQHLIRSYDSKGVPFRTFLYVPELHPLLNEEFHEREDEGHVFKVNEMYWLYTNMSVTGPF